MLILMDQSIGFRFRTSLGPGNVKAAEEVKGHIFVSEKGAYYEIMDGLPQFETIPEGQLRS